MIDQILVFDEPEHREIGQGIGVSAGSCIVNGQFPLVQVLLNPVHFFLPLQLFPSIIDVKRPSCTESLVAITVSTQGSSAKYLM